MNRIYMMFVTALTLGSALVVADAPCGVPSGTAYCSDPVNNYPNCGNSTPHNNLCNGNSTNQCSVSTQNCSLPDLTQNPDGSNTCSARKDTKGNPIYEQYTSYGSTSTPCGS
jgi:hypothetical protein